MIFLVIIIISAVITYSSGLSNITSLDVSLVKAGEVWRLLTGHLTHITWIQYLLDAPVFLISYVAYRRNAGGLSAVNLALISAFIVSLAVVVIGIHQVYGGLSGLSCAAISALSFKLILDNPHKFISYILFFSFLIYLLFLQGNVSRVNVAKEAHLAGALSGLIYELIRHQIASKVSII